MQSTCMYCFTVRWKGFEEINLNLSSHKTLLLPLGRQHTILDVIVFSCPFPQYLARVMYGRELDLASVKMSVDFSGDDYFEVL